MRAAGDGESYAGPAWWMGLFYMHDRVDCGGIGTGTGGRRLRVPRLLKK